MSFHNLFKIKLLKLIKVNFINKKVIRSKSKYIIPFKSNVYIHQEKNSRIELRGNLRLNSDCIKKNGRSTLLRMDQNSVLEVNDNFSIYYNADVIMFKNSRLVLNGGYINTNCKIRCHKYISIGSGCAIAHDCTIMDSSAHPINGILHQGPVIINNNVWIGSRVLILPNVTIGEGAVIGAGSVVTRNIPPNTLSVGNPARVIKHNVSWS